MIQHTMVQPGVPPLRSPRSDPKGSRRHSLSKVEIFRDLSEQQIHEVDREIRMSTVPKGRLIFHEDETGEGLFFLMTGTVQVYRISPEGHRFVIRNIEPGTFFGERAFMGHSAYGSFAEALERSVLGVMRRRAVKQLINRHPVVGIRIIQALIERLKDAETELEDLALKSVASRLAGFVLRESRNDDEQIVGLTHNDVAERVGTTRETATQSLDALKARGLIDIGHKRIEVLDREGLQEVAEMY